MTAPDTPAEIRRLGIFDSHAHYDDKRFDGDRSEVLREVLDAVEYVVNIGCDVKSSLESALLASENDRVYASVGIHPHESGRQTDEAETLDRLRRLLRREKVVAIGEIGLDYHYDFSDRASQAQWFRLQMELASETGFPVIIHDREAHGDCLDMVKKFPGVTGVFHSYSGSAETAAELVKLGWYISFSGVVTFKNASKILDAVQAVPTHRLLIETDCPYLAPHPFRGERNDSRLLVHTAAKIAEIKGLSLEETCRVTRENAMRLYRI